MDSRRVARKVIKQAIIDLIGPSRAQRLDAERYVKSARLEQHAQEAGYPGALSDTLRDMVLCSEIERQMTGKEVLSLLHEHQQQEVIRKKESPS